MRYEIGARGRFGLKRALGIPDHLAEGSCVIDLEPGDRLVWTVPRGELSASEIELVEASGVPLFGVYVDRARVSGHDLEALVRLAMKIKLLLLAGVKVDPPDALAATRLRVVVLIDSSISVIPSTAEEVDLATHDLTPWIPMLNALPDLRLAHLLVRRGLELPSALLQIPATRIELSQITETDDALLALFERAPIAPRAPLVVRIEHQTVEIYARIERAIEGTGITVDRGRMVSVHQVAGSRDGVA